MANDINAGFRRLRPASKNDMSRIYTIRDQMLTLELTTLKLMIIFIH